MEINTIRINNLKELIVNKFNDSANKFAKEMGARDATNFYAIFAGKKPFGERLARKIEKKLNLEPYSLDREAGAVKTEEPEYVDIPVLDIKLCAGDGSYHEHAIIIDKVPMSKVWLNKHGFNQKYLEFISVKGACMEPSLHDGDLVLVDRSQNEIKSGKLYAYCYDGEANIKRLFIEGSKTTMKPDNDIFPTRTISKQEAEVNGFKVFGRIVFAHRVF